MYKLGLIVTIALAIVACTKTTPVVSQPVTQDECGKLYQHMLVITVINDVDPEWQLPIREFKNAMWEVDQQWQSEGKTERFYHICSQMSMVQMQCAMLSFEMADINSCVKLQPNINHE